MVSWRDEVIEVFSNQVPTLYLVSDPDGLLYDELVLKELKDRKIEMVDIKDNINFRYIFESKYRSAVVNKLLTLVIRTDSTDYNELPYDLLNMGIQHKLSLSNIFPQMSYPTIKQLSTTDLDVLYTVYKQYQGSSSKIETIRFLLNKVYRIYPELIETTSDLMKFLLSHHYQKVHLPEELETYIIETLKQNVMLKPFPVEEMVRSRSYFYSYLQNEWDEYVSQLVNESEQVNDPVNSQSYYHTEHSFSHPDVRRLMNDLFYENKLQPIKGYHKEKLPSWTHPGIVTDTNDDLKERLYKLNDIISEKLEHGLSYKSWIEIASLYGECGYLFYQMQSSDEEIRSKYNDLSNRVNEQFEIWMFENYGTLYNIPYYPTPVMVDKIPHYLESLKRDKVALVVLDGMNFMQWSQIKQYLSNNNIKVQESGTFAWVPTLTSISRQAIFSGKLPMMFSDSIHTTNKEEKLWKTFWENSGISRQKVSYQRSLGQGSFKDTQIEALNKKNINVAGLVVDTIDELTHGAIQGHKGMNAEIDIWLKDNYLLELITRLSKAGYSVFLTSDHGNTECVGIGRLSDGVLVHSKGERVRIYNDQVTRDERMKEYSLTNWPKIAIPENMHVLLANDNKAFIPKGQHAVSHGSISLSEVIVPFVEVKL
ncbi:BREX-3 system phosphatase PglZ [Alkalibacillus haloalkaliphilus]|uniref:Alkaline phosphatase n=1 Tax=Alkalibacillus haloalkaliphilus TaxID=94136 RepID=A0A511W6S6_9BACI|nr:BREX-3 system phosphatase PglZ [Alkalibacillus haloalkaliphilus]GEN46746.1 alkaline phosphatase [Alkalibacillus haloalkaliphilus]